MTKKVTRRHFTDQFLWTVIVVVLLAFIALWIYQKTMKQAHLNLHHRESGWWPTT